MDVDDPLGAASSAAHLLPWTLGPAPAAFPSKGDEALLRVVSRPLKGSKEVIDQARMAMKEHGDIQMLYQDDGDKAGAAANGKINHPGRKPAPERKRPRFILRGPVPTSKTVPVVDYSVLKNITDPAEYFATAERLEQAEREIKRLTGEAPTGITYNFDPVVRKRRRNSVHNCKFRLLPKTQNPIEVPASQIGSISTSQLSQDDARTSPEKDEVPVSSRSSKHAISDASAKEDSFTEKDKGDVLTYILTSLRDMDKSDKSKVDEFMRETLGLPEISMDSSCLRDSVVPGDRPPRSNTVQKSPERVCSPKSGKYLAQILEFEKRIAFRDAEKDKCADLSTDDDLEGPQEIVMGEQSRVPDSPDAVLITDETIAARDISKEAPSLSIRSAEFDLDPEPNMPNRVMIDDRQALGSPIGLSRDTDVAKEKDPCSRNSISIEFELQEDDMPVDCPTFDKPNNDETEVSSSHHLVGSSMEVLVSTPGRNVATDDIAKSSHQEAAEQDSFAQDDSSHPLEILPDDDDPKNQSKADDPNIEELAGDMENALSRPKDMQKTAQEAKRKQQSKRGNQVADDPLEISQANSDSENQPPMHDVNMEKLAAGMKNALSAAKGKKKASQKGKRKQPKRGNRAADESSHPPEVPQENSDSENRPAMRDINIGEQMVSVSNALQSKVKGRKEYRRNNNTKHRKSLADAGLVWHSGVRRSTRIRARPLEHWAGERFVYGRIHDTMPTVIGVKVYSPGQDGKKTLKVKSLVPEQYSDLVATSGMY